jgi:lipoate-protein ligase A
MPSPTERIGAAAWRLLDTPPADGAWNMALDEALAESVREGGAPVLRFYRWSPPCLSLGRNQPADGRYDPEALRARGLDVVRRPTGGRAVLHDRELTYSVAVPDGVLGPPRAAYSAVNRALVAGLRRLGVDASTQGETGRRAPLPSLAPCFAEPVEGEVVAGGRKLVGSAQRRLDGVILQHGSLPVEDDQSTVADLLREPAGADAPAALAPLLGRAPEWSELVEALAAGWREALGVALARGDPTGAERGRAGVLRRHYASPAWTWHR